MFSSKLDIRLVISVVSACVNKMNVHVKNLKKTKTASTLVMIEWAQLNNGDNVWQE